MWYRAEGAVLYCPFVILGVKMPGKVEHQKVVSFTDQLLNEQLTAQEHCDLPIRYMHDVDDGYYRKLLKQ